MNLGPEINLQVVIKSQRLNFPFDLLQVVLVDEIFPKQDVRKKHKHGQGADHNGKNLVPNKTGTGARTGDDGRSGGLDGRHLQRTGGGDDTHAGVQETIVRLSYTVHLGSCGSKSNSSGR